MTHQPDISRGRLVYVDNFKVFLTFMVIVHHAAIAYGGSGGWGVKDPNVDAISRFVLPIFNGLNQSYFMSAFFLFAGYFTPASLAKKGVWRFSADRCIKLGVPLLLYTTVGYPATIRLVEIASGQMMPVSREFGFHAGHLWFLEALLIFSAIYLLFHALLGRSVARRVLQMVPEHFPSNRTLALVILALTMMTFMVRCLFPIGETVADLQLGHFTHYVFCFFAGAVAYRKRWFDKLTAAQVSTLRRTAFIAMPGILLIGLFGGALSDPETFEEALHGGLHWHSFAYAAWESVLMISIIVSLLGHFQSKYNRKIPLYSFFAANAYAVYIFHQIVLLWINAVLLSSAIPSILKLVISVLVTVIICLAISSAIRKIPGADRILG
jgi:glucans biosynthesis protein C